MGVLCVSAVSDHKLASLHQFHFIVLIFLYGKPIVAEGKRAGTFRSMITLPILIGVHFFLSLWGENDIVCGVRHRRRTKQNEKLLNCYSIHSNGLPFVYLIAFSFINHLVSAYIVNLIIYDDGNFWHRQHYNNSASTLNWKLRRVSFDFSQQFHFHCYRCYCCR